MQRTRLALLVAIVLAALVGLTWLFSGSQVSTTRAQGCWSTDNEDVSPGDWTGIVLYDDDDSVGRSALAAYSGSYSYLHHTGTNVTQLDAFTYYSLGSSYRIGTLDVWFMADPVTFERPGASGADDHGLFSLTEFDGAVWIAGWTVSYSTWNDRLIFDCNSCSSFQRQFLGLLMPGTWQHLRVEWSLPANPNTGNMRVWLDEYNYVDKWGVVMRAAADAQYSDMDEIAVGPQQWHPTSSNERDIFIDDVQACDEWPLTPTPVATPTSVVCDQYGHAAVINVDDDCVGVLRFDNVASLVPGDATITSAELRIYGIASEVLGEEIHVTPLVPIWGEMTCDWCRRTVGSQWTEAGASNIPSDRLPGRVATFVTALGWISIPLPTSLVQEWAQTNAANPGLRFWNPWLTGKFSFASSEYYHPTTDYTPQLIVYYTED